MKKQKIMYFCLYSSFNTQYPENNFKNYETCKETGKCDHVEEKTQSKELDQQMTKLLELAE